MVNSSENAAKMQNSTKTMSFEKASPWYWESEFDPLKT